MADRIHFTKTAIETVQAPSHGRMHVFDTKVRGLALRITDKGAKSFYVYRKVNRKPVRVFICKWPDLTVEQIRKQAEAINARLARGENPIDDRREARECKTLSEVWAWYLQNYAKPHKKSWRFDEWQYNRFLTSWGGRRLADIEPADVQALHTKIGCEVGKVPANRLRSLLQKIFEVARHKLKYVGANPVAGVERFPEVKRTRHLGQDELARLLRALDGELNQMLADFFRLALFTGARRGNLCSAQWDEINWETAVWTIPGAKAKAGEPIDIPLSKEALEVLARRRSANHQPWVFPSHGKEGHLVDPKTAWKRICKAAGLTNVRIHDLRHTFASWMVARGTSLFITGRALGHANESTTQRYAHMQLDALREALSGATAAMAAAKSRKSVDKSKVKGLQSEL